MWVTSRVETAYLCMGVPGGSEEQWRHQTRCMYHTYISWWWWVGQLSYTLKIVGWTIHNQSFLDSKVQLWYFRFRKPKYRCAVVGVVLLLISIEMCPISHFYHWGDQQRPWLWSLRFATLKYIHMYIRLMLGCIWLTLETEIASEC